MCSVRVVDPSRKGGKGVMLLDSRTQQSGKVGPCVAVSIVSCRQTRLASNRARIVAAAPAM